MATNVKLIDIMRTCDGSGNIVEFLDKFELLVKRRDSKQVETVLPMFLEGGTQSSVMIRNLSRPLRRHC